uniref:Uncharacterized protein n=1 Tax=Amphimedon queenslandica TaxID=400682 RepID=A0A1X7U7I1_AMPQE
MKKPAMKSPVLLLFFVIFYVKSDSIHVVSNSQLEEVLCSNNTYNNDTTILLTARMEFSILPGKYCTINVSHSLTIASDNKTVKAQIACMPSDHQNNGRLRGFAFYGTGSLTIRMVIFHNCGTNFTTLDSRIINSTTSRVYFTHDHAAALIISGIPRVQLLSVVIVNYTGFALILVNLPNATLQLGYFREKNNVKAIGSGVLVLFYDQETPLLVSEYSLTFSHCKFEGNHVHYQSSIVDDNRHCVSEIYKNSYSMPVVSAAGLTILYTQSDARATVTLSYCHIIGCSGYFAGGMLIVQFNSSVDSKTIINNEHYDKSRSSNFSSNVIMKHNCRGAAIAAVFYFNNNELNTTYRPLTITNASFFNNSFSLHQNSRLSGAIDIAVIDANNLESMLHPKIELVFHGLVFFSNFGNGACMSAAVHSYLRTTNFVHILLESVTAFGNPNMTLLPLAKKHNPMSLFSLSNVNVNINGSRTDPGNFSYNYGSVFVLMNSNAYLEGFLIFDSNIGHNGAALLLKGNSYLYLKESLNASFLNNAVQSLGGTICATHSSSFRCTFQVLSNDINDISLKFINNTAALAGNAIYSTNLYQCSIIKGHIMNNLADYYNTIINNASVPDISSVAEKILFCNKKERYKVYPGGTIRIPIGVYDYSNSSTFEIVTVIIVEETNVLKKVNWWLSDDQNTFVIKGELNCTVVNLTVHTRDASILNKSSLFLFSLAEENKVIAANVLLRKCPLGFQLDAETGTCQCSDIFNFYKTFEKQKIFCNISSNTFRKPNILNLWLSTDQTDRKLFIGFCNPSYCNIGSQFDVLHFNSTGSYLSSSETSKTIPLCFGSRKGILCGECITNYSVVLGSNECKMCSSKWWPLTSIIYILEGPLLVFLLFNLKLTLTTGTLNGIIFYVQLANLGHIKYLNMLCSEDCANEYFLVKFSNAILSLLNLNVAFPICLYDGMTELWKAGLNLFLPVYLILIIGFLIILSHFSTTVSNKLAHSSVQVLITVVHLSFTKLLQAFIETFGVSLYYEDGVKEPKRVWYNSGAVEYGSVEHKCLIILTSSVVGLILTPYLVLIVFGKFIMKVDKFREYIRPLYETVHAPYKTNKWYWFSFQQFILLLAYFAATLVNHALTVHIAIMIGIGYLCLQLYSMPFKNKIINVLNSFFIFNLVIIAMTCQYVYLTDGSPKYMVISFALLNYPVFIIFGFVITYHRLLVTNKLGKVHSLYEKIAACFKPTRKQHYQNNCNDSDDCTVREPLLERS